MENELEQRQIRQNRIQAVLCTVALSIGVVCIALVIFWAEEYCGGFGWRSHPSLEFNWHPVLMVIGIVLSFVPGIMMHQFKSYKNYLHLSERTVDIIHGVVFPLIFFAFMVMGYITVFDSHNFKVPPTANVYSLHSWIGIMSTVFFIFQWLLGVYFFLIRDPAEPMNEHVRTQHSLLGRAVFGILAAAVITGFTEKAAKQYMMNIFSKQATLINTMGVVFVVFSIVVFISIRTRPKFKV